MSATAAQRTPLPAIQAYAATLIDELISQEITE
jgi:hypothetical protein